MTVVIKDKQSAYFGREAEVSHEDPRGIYLVRVKSGEGSVSFAVKAVDTEIVEATQP